LISVTRRAPGEDQRANPEGWKVNAHEIKPGLIYKDERVTVTAFTTQHAMEIYGYRFDTPGRIIVISGDTSTAGSTCL
jgi:ribonuclease Z